MIVKRIQGAKKIIEAHFWVFSEIFWYFLHFQITRTFWPVMQITNTNNMLINKDN